MSYPPELEPLLANAKTDIEKCDILYEYLYERRDEDAKQNLHLANEAKALAEKNNYKKGIAQSLIIISWRNLLFGNYELTLE